MEAKEFAGFGGGDAGVGGEAIEVVKALARRPGRQSGLALLSELLLECGNRLAGAGIARRHGTTGAGVAAFEMDVTDGEAHDAAFVFAEQLIFPEGGYALDFQGGAEALADTFYTQGEPTGNGFEGRSGDDGGSVGDGIVGETSFGVADDDLLFKEDAEPFGGVFVFGGEGKGTRRDFAAIARNGKGDRGKIRGVTGANQVDRRGAFAIDPFAIDGIEGPGTIEREATGRGDARFGYGDGIERFDGVEADVGERGGRGHAESLADGWGKPSGDANWETNTSSLAGAGQGYAEAAKDLP